TAALPLLVERRLEALLVDALALLFGDLTREVDGEAVGVGQGERERAGEHAAAGHGGQLVVEQLEAAAARAAEPPLLAPADLGHEPATLGELGVRGLELADHGVGDVVEERAIELQLHAEADRAAHDA